MFFISGQLLRELVPMFDAINAVRSAFRKVSAAGVEQPTRLALTGGTALAMLAMDRSTNSTVLKAVTVRPHNRAVGRPAVQAVVIFFDGESGTPEAIIDGTSLTALRTGAASGVATDLLARNDAHVLAMIGAGGQAADQVRAVCAVRPINEVRIASRSRASSQSLVEMLRGDLPLVRVIAAESTADAIGGADVICTATSATSPLFAVEDLSKNVHINAIGAYTPEMCELPSEVLRGATVIAVDEAQAAMAEAGDLLQAIDKGHMRWADVTELGTVLGRAPAVHAGWTVFKSVGIAAQDLEVAGLAVRRARASDLAIPSLPW